MFSLQLIMQNDKSLIKLKLSNELYNIICDTELCSLGEYHKPLHLN